MDLLTSSSISVISITRRVASLVDEIYVRDVHERFDGSGEIGVAVGGLCVPVRMVGPRLVPLGQDVYVRAVYHGLFEAIGMPPMVAVEAEDHMIVMTRVPVDEDDREVRRTPDRLPHLHAAIEGRAYEPDLVLHLLFTGVYEVQRIIIPAHVLGLRDDPLRQAIRYHVPLPGRHGIAEANPTSIKNHAFPFQSRVMYRTCFGRDLLLSYSVPE